MILPYEIIYAYLYLFSLGLFENAMISMKQHKSLVAYDPPKSMKTLRSRAKRRKGWLAQVNQSL